MSRDRLIEAARAVIDAYDGGNQKAELAPAINELEHALERVERFIMGDVVVHRQEENSE